MLKSKADLFRHALTGELIGRKAAEQLENSTSFFGVVSTMIILEQRKDGIHVLLRMKDREIDSVAYVAPITDRVIYNYTQGTRVIHSDDSRFMLSPNFWVQCACNQLRELNVPRLAADSAGFAPLNYHIPVHNELEGVDHTQPCIMFFPYDWLPSRISTDVTWVNVKDVNTVQFKDNFSNQVKHHLATLPWESLPKGGKSTLKH